MGQYWMPKRLDARNLRKCLRNYKANSIFIRTTGSADSIAGTTKVTEPLRGRKLDFTMGKSGLSIFIDEKPIFHFPLKIYDKGFSLEYERVGPTDGGVGRMVLDPDDGDPHDPSLPEPKRSILRTVLDDHLMEIAFEGRVHLRFHSWWMKPHWKYWVVEKPLAKK
jgi:hypothetical protein